MSSAPRYKAPPVARARMQPTPEELVDAYNAVFAVHGGAPLASAGPHVAYAEDRLRALLGAPFGEALNLSTVCALSRAPLLRLLFQAAAGQYITNAGALEGQACRLVADQATGTLAVARDRAGSEAALTAIALVLLCVVAALLYRRDA